MSPIRRPVHVLPENLARLVRAGEVVRDPACVVRELADNAADAGASEIRITLSDDGGIEAILVEDDGHGMTPEDLTLCLLPHATSKTHGPEDLDAPKTLGFRGEALHALATCADVSITSRIADSDTNDGAAWRIESRDSHVGEVVPTSGMLGTRVRVSDLFTRVPARLAMLGTASKRRVEVKRAVMRLALARPHVGFTLTGAGAPLRLPRAGLVERIAALFPGVAGTAVDFAEDGRRLCGLLAELPRGEGALVVNGRAVIRDTAIAAAMTGLPKALTGGRRMTFVGTLDVPSAALSHNVHAAKEEVRHADPAAVTAFVRRALTAATGKVLGGGALHDWTGVGIRALEANDLAERPLGRVMGVMGDNYVAARTADGGLVLVDAHAAHERILLEEMRLSARERCAPVRLNTPVCVMPPPSITDAIGLLADLGVEAVEMDGRVLAVLAVPESLVGVTDASAVLSWLAAAARGEDAALVVMADAACRAAFRTGDGLTHEAAEALLRRMEVTPSSSVCNHGRPTTVKLSPSDMARLFGRRG